MPEPRILQAHRLNVSYARLSFMEPTPAALVNLFVRFVTFGEIPAGAKLKPA